MAISDKKLFRGRRNRGNNWFVPAEFRLFRGTENFRNAVPNRSTEEKMLAILYHGTKLEANARNSVLNHSAEEKTTWNSVPKHVSHEKMLSVLFAGSGFFVKLIFFMPFHSVSGFGIDSSINFGMPRNEHFLPRNNGSCSESIPRNFFGKKFRCQPKEEYRVQFLRGTTFCHAS